MIEADKGKNKNMEKASGILNAPNLDALRRHKPTMIGMDRAKKSAVCIPLVPTEHGYDVLFEVRSAQIGSQPGDICFPGGMVEPGETPQEAAVREMMEELLVRPAQIELLGLMDLLGGTRLYVYPYAAILRDYGGTFSEDEVAEVFFVPLSFFLENEPELYRTHMRVIPEEGFPYERIHGGRDYAWRERTEDVLFYSYAGHHIWGITAKILASFVEIWKNEV